MAFRVALHKGAIKALSGIPKPDRERIKKLLDGLESNPWPDGIHREQLHGPLNSFVKARCGNYRIAYEIRQDQVLVMVLVIGDRKEIYRLLEEFVK